MQKNKIKNAVLHEAQQVAVKSFQVFHTGLCARRVWCVESVAVAVGRTVALIMQVLQVLRGGKKEFSLPGSSGPEGQHAQAKEKADWLHILSVFVPVWTSFSLPSIEGGDFPLSLISTVEHHGGGE